MADKKELLRRHYLEVWNEGKVELIDQLLDPQYEGSIPFIGKVDRDGERAAVGMFRKALPDLRFEIQDIVVEGDKGVVSWNVHGTSRGEFLGIPPSGKSETVHGLSLVEFSGDRVRKDITELDLPKLMSLLGMPVPPQPAQIASAQRQAELRH